MSEENYSPSDFIPKPCKENWHAMSGDEKKRHCEKCDTHVHDLTGMSAEVILAMRKKNGGKLCGAFRLGRPIALGSGIASLALASCSDNKGKDLVLPGIVCEPAPEEKAVDKKKTTQEQFKPTNSGESPAEVVPPKIIEPIQPMLLGDICPQNQPIPKPGSGPI